MNGQTLTRSNRFWLVNTTGIEVREMWFPLAIKCLQSEYSNTVLHDSFFFSNSYVIILLETPWARKDYNDLGRFELFNLYIKLGLFSL